MTTHDGAGRASESSTKRRARDGRLIIHTNGDLLHENWVQQQTSAQYASRLCSLIAKGSRHS